MPLKIKTTREYVIPCDNGEDSFWVKFRFKHSEDEDWTEFRKLVQDTEAAKNKAVDYIIRRSIVETDIVDEATGQPILLTGDSAVVENNQKAIMDVIKFDPEYYVKVLTAYVGTRSKNLKTGAMESSTGAGDPASA